MTFGGPFLLAPLSSMLGIRAGMNVSIHAAPAGFMEKLLPLPEGCSLLDHAKLGIDVSVLFTLKKPEMIEKMPAILRAMAPMGAVWVVFPSDSVDLFAPNEDFVRLAALEVGLVDTKKLMLDPAWTGLRLQWKAKPPRLEVRQARA